MKKLSELMLEGYAMVGRQCRGAYFRGDPIYPTSVCAAGAAFMAGTGRAYPPLKERKKFSRQFVRFADSVGSSIADLNDEGMSIPDIAGIAAAEGL